MDGSELTASLVRSLAWPLVVVVALFLFRSVIASALGGQLKRSKVGPVEAEYWERNIEEAREDLPPEADAEAEKEVGGGLVGELTPVAEVAPRAAVLEAFIRVERALRQLTEDVVPGGRVSSDGAHLAGPLQS